MTDSAKILSAKLHELTEAPNFTVQVIHNKRVILKKRGSSGISGVKWT
jgi:hypothetical protein